MAARASFSMHWVGGLRCLGLFWTPGASFRAFGLRPFVSGGLTPFEAVSRRLRQTMWFNGLKRPQMASNGFKRLQTASIGLKRLQTASKGR